MAASTDFVAIPYRGNGLILNPETLSHVEFRVPNREFSSTDFSIGGKDPVFS